jgi:polyferredoxin
MMPLPLRHQQARYLFQALWLLIIGALLLAGAELPVWIGLLAAGLASALLFKRAACSVACPLFACGELLWRFGARRFGRNVAPPFWFDLLLRSAKYLLLAWVLLWLSTGNWPELPAGAWPPVLLLAALLILSLFFQLPWCRYLCPYGALLGLAALPSLLTIRRSTRHCVRCHKCSNRCPANLPVMLLTSVRSAECFACYRCIDGCPAPGALAFAPPGKRGVPAWVTGILLSLLLFAGILAGLTNS